MLKEKSLNSIQTILTQVFEHTEEMPALIVYDTQAPLARIIADAYKTLLPKTDAIVFEELKPETILEKLKSLSAGSLVILIQSSSFRLDAFRIRVHLFERGIKVIEHPHLGRVHEDEFETYIDSLAYDTSYYRSIGPAIKARLDRAQEVRIQGDSHSLVYGGPLEASKLNIGDYREMKNAGGQFPIGEVFTELRDLKQLNGDVALFAFGDQNFSVAPAEPPIVLEIQKGRIVNVKNSVAGFDAVLNDIRNHEGELWVRELGFGLNRALTRDKRIRDDVGIYERMCGVHLSLGSKHAIYPKEGFHKKKVKYHVDVFAVVDKALIDGNIVYEQGRYLLD